MDKDEDTHAFSEARGFPEGKPSATRGGWAGGAFETEGLPASAWRGQGTVNSEQAEMLVTVAAPGARPG